MEVTLQWTVPTTAGVTGAAKEEEALSKPRSVRAGRVSMIGACVRMLSGVVMSDVSAKQRKESRRVGSGG
jgi:hypothetical protein